MKKFKIDNIGKELSQQGLCLDLEAYNCCKQKSRFCPIENAEGELRDLPGEFSKDKSPESSERYCVGLAKELFSDPKNTNTMEGYRYKECGHYAFNSGRHRACILLKAYQRGWQSSLSLEASESDGWCEWCSKMKDLNTISRLAFLKRIKARSDLRECYIIGGS